MAIVDLTDTEWQQLLHILATKCLWSEANPFLMKIGAQLQAQSRPGRVQSTPPGGGIRLDLDGKETIHE